MVTWLHYCGPEVRLNTMMAEVYRKGGCLPHVVQEVREIEGRDQG
jgi:hypothetical protein